ncbi:MAG: hypothetical protein ABI586_03720 [Candidatus Nanopelagicales bacterium]
MTSPDTSRASSSKGSGAVARRVFMHVGAPKTGTTYLQGILWSNRAALKSAGLHVIGQGRGDHYRGGHDLRDLPYNPKDPRPDWTGAWDVLAGLALDSDAMNVVISDEHLAALTPDQVSRAVKALAPREVHVVYATRNLARLLPSEWQEFVKHRSPLTFADWSQKVFASRQRGPGKWFWSVHDPVDVVKRWSSGVPIDRIHVITLPPPSAEKNELWRRFAGVVGVDPDAATKFDVAGNDSLGWAEAEVLRRVNIALPESFPRWHHTGLARDVLATKILSPRSRTGRPALPPKVLEQVLARSERSLKGLQSSGCEIVGSLDELKVTDEVGDGEPMPSDEEMLEAAVDGIAGLLVRMGRVRDDRRRTESRLRRQLRESGPVVRARTRIAGLVDRSRPGAAVLDRYRAVRARNSSND